MTDWTPRLWPDPELDKELIAMHRKYRSAFERLGDGGLRPLLTRLGDNTSTLNCVIVSLPPGQRGRGLAHDCEMALLLWLGQVTGEGPTFRVERHYDG